MAPRRGPLGEMVGATEPSPEVIYPIVGVSDHPLVLMQAPLAINALYLLCTISFAIIYWKFIKCGVQKGVFYELPFALIFISSSTAFNISTGALFLADENVRQTYNLMRGFFVMCYYLGKLCLIEVVLATLHNRFGAFTPRKTPKSVFVVTYLGRVFITVMFCLVVVIAALTIKYSADSNNLYRSKGAVTYQDTIMGYQVHWDRITLAYDCMLLLAGLYFTGFSAYLLCRADKLKQHKKEIKVFFTVVSTAVVANGIFFVTVDSASLGAGIRSPWSYVNLAQTIIDAVTMTCAFAGVVWVGLKREDWTPGITEAGTPPHLRDILLQQARQQ